MIRFNWSNQLFVNGEFIRVCTEREIYLVGLVLGWYEI